MFVVLLVGLSAGLSLGLLKTYGFTCMTVLPEVCLVPRNKRIDFGDDPDYDPDPIARICLKILPEVCQDLDYDQ